MSLRGVRLITGLVLMLFVTGHMANLMLGMHSLAAMEHWRPWLMGPWRSGLGQGLLVCSALVHLALGLYAICARRSLAMSKTDVVQLCLGSGDATAASQSRRRHAHGGRSDAELRFHLWPDAGGVLELLAGLRAAAAMRGDGGLDSRRDRRVFLAGAQAGVEAHRRSGAADPVRDPGARAHRLR